MTNTPEIPTLMACPLCGEHENLHLDGGRDFAVKCGKCWQIRIAGSDKAGAIENWNKCTRTHLHPVVPVEKVSNSTPLAEGVEKLVYQYGYDKFMQGVDNDEEGIAEAKSQQSLKHLLAAYQPGRVDEEAAVAAVAEIYAEASMRGEGVSPRKVVKVVLSAPPLSTQPKQSSTLPNVGDAEVIERVLVGGNHLANWLLGKNIFPAFYKDYDAVLEVHGHEAADVWSGWKGIIDFRDSIKAMQVGKE